MGTYLRVELPEGYSPYRVYRYLRSLEEKLSTYIDDSEVSRINKNAGIKPVRVSEELLEILGYSMYVYRKTFGFFNVAVGAYTINFKRRGVIEEERALELMDISDIEVSGNRVFLRKPFMALDFGGIGKGYAVEKAYRVVNSTRGFIGIAGDMKVWGMRKTLAVKDPTEGGSLLQMINRKDVCLSTSGNYYKKHIRSHSELLQITVAHENCILADAYATALFSMPRSLRERFLRENPRVGVLELYPDDSLYMNRAFREYFEVMVLKGKGVMQK